MSFLRPKDIIEEGDDVVLYLKVNSMHAITVTPTIKNKKGKEVENIFQTSYGALKVKDLAGVTYGSRVELSRGWGYVLQPNPELWTLTLNHRTQIIYTPDISMIIFQLEIRPGSIVFESGTGSGSLSHYFIRALKPHGHLHTFDFHKMRVEQAESEFNQHGLRDFVTTYQRDVCEFGFPEELDHQADAVFLDLPAPHIVVPHVVRALKRDGGRICSFSPCIEQSQRVCIALQEHGFTAIRSMEVLQREEIIKMRTFTSMDLEMLKHKPEEIPSENVTEETEKVDGKASKAREAKKVLTSWTPSPLSGHTGYLTVATLPPFYD